MNLPSSVIRNARITARRISKRKLAALAITGTAALVVLAPPRVGMLAAFLLLAAGVAGIGAAVADLRRTLRAAGGGLASRTGAERPYPVRWLEERLWNGFSTTALVRLRKLSVDTSASPGTRAHALRVMADWYTAAGDEERAQEHALLARLSDPQAAPGAAARPRRRSGRAPRHYDVVLVSNFNFPGGTTSSNAQEIQAQARAGLRTGLLHHPIYDWNAARPVNPKILELVDHDRTRFIDRNERVTCDLLIVRAPKLGERLMDDMPRIEAGSKAVIVDQPPMREYGASGGRSPAWDLGACAANFRAWLGEHHWYPIGPSVRGALLDHHAADLAGVPLADEDWVNIIDLPAWKREARRIPDGTVRIGRHSRDDQGKWPETAALLKAAYPDRPGYEIHVLGGTDTPARTLRRIPRNWTAHAFDTMPVREFLHGLDVYVYFTASDYCEAFGRAPLEALATGLPTILPFQFKELFGDGAVYAAPEDVRDQVELLMSDSAYYARQAERGFETVRQRFDHRVHLDRIARLGVRV